jgi:hypothetical protein
MIVVDFQCTIIKEHTHTNDGWTKKKTAMENIRNSLNFQNTYKRISREQLYQTKTKNNINIPKFAFGQELCLALLQFATD